MRKFDLFLASLFLCTGFAAANAQDAPKNVRGVLVTVDGATLAVKSRAGETLKVHVDDHTLIAAAVSAQLSDIKAGSFVGAAVLPADDGSFTAMEVHIFPEAARGFGEGSRPFDLAPGSVMTNANVSGKVDDASGPTLKLTFKGGEQTVKVDKATPIVQMTDGALTDLKPGASVIVRGPKGPDGVVEATRVIVGRDGLNLPM